MSDRAKTTSAFLRLSAADRKVDEVFLETALAEALTWTHPHGEPDAYAHEMAIAYFRMREELECWRRGEIIRSPPGVAREPLVQEVIAAVRAYDDQDATEMGGARMLAACRELARWTP